MIVVRDDDGNVVAVVGSIDYGELAELGIDEFANPVVGDLSKLTKAELVDRAEKAGVDTSGAKAEIIERLKALATESEG